MALALLNKPDQFKNIVFDSVGKPFPSLKLGL
jgi:hypothetical protein